MYFVCVAIVTAHVIVAHPNLAVVSRRAAYASPRASNLTSVTIVIATSRLATRTTHVSTLARLAGAGAGRLTSSRAPRRRATPCRRQRRGTVAVHTAILTYYLLPHDQPIFDVSSRGFSLPRRSRTTLRS